MEKTGTKDTVTVPADSSKKVQQSSRWIRELKNIIIVSPKNEAETDTFNVESPSHIFQESEGRKISKIRITRLKPFGASITDTAEYHLNGLSRAGNAIHVPTRDFRIRSLLLFREGDVINNFNLSDSERFLRSQRFIEDARIEVIPVSEEEAEVHVIVHDIFPYNVSGGTNFLSNVHFALSNENIGGLGVDLKNEVFIDSRKKYLMGYGARLRVPSIGRSFMSFETEYLDKYENKRFGFALDRKFHAPTTKYAGNISLYRTQIAVHYYDPDRPTAYLELNPVSVTYDYLNTWLGRSFQIKKNPINRQRNNITLAVAVYRTHFLHRPENSQNYYYQFQNRKIFLGSVSYSRQAHYKTNLIYNFGRTEDVSYGYLFSIVAGREFNELYNRPYLGSNFSAGYFIPRFGYWAGEIKFGTFFRKGTEQGTVDLETNYFSNLYITGKYRQRTFVNIQYTRQLNNKLENYLDIEENYGIPGFRNDSILGRQRLNLSIEQNVFTPWKLYGFRFVVYAFANFSLLGKNERNIFDSPFYSSFGAGIRIKNDRFIFGTLQIRLAFFPNIPSNSKFHYINVSREDVLNHRDFSPKAPEITLRY